VFRGGAVSLLALATLAHLTPVDAWADAWPACAGVSPTTHEAAGARDGATLRLTDGREVRLAGVIAASDLDGDEAAVRQATAALDRLVAGKRILLYSASTAGDRYGRLLAQVALADEGGWVQGLLVANGRLRVGPEAGEPACSEALIAEERVARAAKRGLWAEPRFSVESADRLTALNAALGRFAVIEGKVTRVGETASRTYLEFGRRHDEEFTIVIPRASRAAFAAAGIDLAALRGKLVRGRGVLISSGGPAIEVRKPASIEIVQGDL